jgi:hypothetical protein
MRVLEEAFAAFKTALATLFDGAAEADGGETAEKTAIAAALAAFGGRRGLLLVLHGSLSAGGTTIVLALGRTILSLRVLSLRGAVASLGLLRVTALVLVAAALLVVVVLSGHGE